MHLGWQLMKKATPLPYVSREASGNSCCSHQNSGCYMICCSVGGHLKFLKEILGINNLKCVLHGGMESKELFCSGLLLCVGCSVWYAAVVLHFPQFCATRDPEGGEESGKPVHSADAMCTLCSQTSPRLVPWLSHTREATIGIYPFAETAVSRWLQGSGLFPYGRMACALCGLLCVSARTLNARSSVARFKKGIPRSLRGTAENICSIWRRKE